MPVKRAVFSGAVFPKADVPVVLLSSEVLSMIRGKNSNGYSVNARDFSIPSASQSEPFRQQRETQQLRKITISISPNTETNSVSKAKFV